MRRLRSILYPALCFVLAWGAVHLVRLMSAVGQEPGANFAPPLTSGEPAKATRASRMEKLRADFAAAKPGEWSALWHEFAAQASIADLQEASRQAAVMFPKLAEEELASRAGILTGSPGSFAAFAARDADEAFKQAKRSGDASFQCAVLRVMAQSDPVKAVSLARRLPAGRPMSIEEAYAFGRSGEPDTCLGAAFSAWTRRDPQAAVAAAEKVPAKLRREALGQVVRLWAYRDGPAALRYIAEQVQAGGSLSDAFRMDYILRASLLSDPSGTAKVLREHPGLRAAFTTEGAELLAVRRWYLADPQAAVEWLRSPEGQGRGTMWLINMVTRANPSAALQLMRQFPKAGFPDHAGNLALIAESEPSAALAVADELGLRAQVEGELRFAEIKANPDGACDRWLAAISKHGAKESLASLGWTSEQALKLAAFASHALPDKAAALAAVMPASVLMPVKRYIGSEQAALKFWPDLQPETKPAPGANAAIPPDPKPPLPFAANPAAAAEALLAGTITEADATKAVNCWAPHDFSAAQAWVAKLPEATRRAAELALAQEQAIHDPAAVLTAASANRFDAPAGLWQQCIRRIALAGGDWKSWAAKAPAGALNENQFTNRNPMEAIEDDVKILAAIRAATGR
jgi:hypothetical protein